MNEAFLSIGSNIENRFVNIKKCYEELGRIEFIKIVNSSSIYETEPWGKKDQNKFLNGVIKIQTSLSIKKLFEIIKNIELKIGRKKREKWGEREIDIDILFFNNIVYNDKNLSIPHKEIENRKFVLIPLNEIESNKKHPVSGKTIYELLKETKDESEVEKYSEKIM